jgi:hypothetical protein
MRIFGNWICFQALSSGPHLRNASKRKHPVSETLRFIQNPRRLIKFKDLKLTVTHRYQKQWKDNLYSPARRLYQDFAAHPLDYMSGNTKALRWARCVCNCQRIKILIQPLKTRLWCLHTKCHGSSHTSIKRKAIYNFARPGCFTFCKKKPSISNVAYFSKIYYHTGAGIAQLYSAGLRAGCWGVRISAGAGNFSLHRNVRPALGPTQPPIQWVPATLPLGVKRPGREADHSPSVPRSRMCGAIRPRPNTPSWRGALLRKA